MIKTAEAVTLRYFSGYIRNYARLCAELEIPAGLPRAEREERILAEGYARWGLDLPKHLCGFYAVALYDEKCKKLVVFRDHVGQKHLFYAVLDGEFTCNGDIDAIASDPRYTKRLNKKTLQHYLFYGFPIGEETFYEGIKKLPAGTVLTWDGKDIVITRYFAPTFEPDESKTAEDWADALETVVKEILDEERADPEVPYKESFLSGGVDSSYLLAAGDAVAANTVGYAESGFDESALARHTAEVLHKGFNVKMISPEEYFDRIPTTIDKLGQPLGDASAVAFSLGCAAVADHAKAVYSGEGIDEFFGGYNAHKREIPSSWVYLTCSHIMSEDFVRSLMKDYDGSLSPADPVRDLWLATEGRDALARKLTVDITYWLEGDIYLNTDRTSTACGVELHTPFSDPRLFEVARHIPARYLFVGEQNKYAFRLAASRSLPDEVAFRKKVGFPVPVRKWLADDRFSERIAAVLFGESSRRFFDQDVLHQLWTSYLNGEETLWNRVYAIYVFLLWYDMKF